MDLSIVRQNLKFEYDKIVIGSGLEALLYAFTKNLPLIFNQDLSPNIFERFHPSVDLSMFGDFKETERGVRKIDLWKRLCFSLSISGKLPLPHNTTSLRIKSEENTIEAFVSETKKVLIGYKELLIFDAKNINGIDATETEKQYEVLDWMNIRSGGKHDLEVLNSEENFVKQIVFYLSNRIDGNKKIKDLVAISHLTEEEKNDTINDAIYARFKVQKMMQSVGIRGAKNGKNPNYPEKSSEPYKYLSLNIEHDRREIREISKAKCETTSNITYMNLTVNDIIEGFDIFESKENFLIHSHSYLWKVNRALDKTSVLVT